MKARIVNGREAERKARKRAKEVENCSDNKVNQLSKVLEKRRGRGDNRTCYDDTSGEP